jgi:ABC-type transporter Mla MlaB component
MADIKITQKRNNSTEIIISGELTIYCVMEAYQKHFQQLKVKEITLLKLGNITEIDTAGVQLLIMLMKIISEQNSNYQITSVGEAVTDYSNLFQLNSYFIDFKKTNELISNKKEDQQ